MQKEAEECLERLEVARERKRWKETALQKQALAEEARLADTRRDVVGREVRKVESANRSAPLCPFSVNATLSPSSFEFSIHSLHHEGKKNTFKEQNRSHPIISVVYLQWDEVMNASAQGASGGETGV